uniref:Ig-like domain-containing protein n=1 Tax=Myripristis murdjan TaxID=586833 RepID=A0A667ZWG2_9TELE
MACHHQACIIFPQQAILHGPLHHSALLANLKLCPPGLSHGAGVLPDNLNGAAGGSVFFTTTVTPPEKPFVMVAWTFISGSGDRDIITSTSSDVIGSGYENRITFDRSTGSLELRNLTMDDTGGYKIVLTPDGGAPKRGDCRLEIFMPVSNVVVTPSSTDLIEFNSSVSLSCSSSGSPPSYTWLNGSSEVTASEGVQITDGGSTLTIISVTRYDQGPFQCRVFNPVSHGISDPHVHGNTTLTIKFPKGSDIILSCSAVSRPPAQFQWALNGALLSDTGSELRLNNIQMNQSGNYSCQAHNIKTRRYQTSQPSRRVSAASITEPPVTPVEGKPVNLTCDAAGSVLTREWRKDGSPVSPGSNIILHDNNRVLSFSPLKRTDSGEYSCTASNPASSAEAKYKMNVSFGPENTNMRLSPSQEYHEKGSNISLSCSAGSRPPAQFQWALNRALLSDTGPELRLNNIQMKQSGNYSCQAHNIKTRRYQTSQSSRVTVLVKVSAASITEPSVTPVEGKPVNLTCDAAGSVLTREWRKDGSPVSPGSNIILHDNNRVLSFSPLKRTDSGEYSCTASNPASSAEAKYKMTVNYGPENVKITGPNEIKVKQTLTLICSAESTPTATYIWMKNGTEIHRNSAEFTKSEIELSDGGEYTCQAGNNITGRTATSDVHRLSVGPQGKAVCSEVTASEGVQITDGENTNMTLSPSQEYHEKGSDIILSCSAVSRPPAQFQWALNGAPLSDTGPELRLNNIQMKQSGNYSCQAHNTKTLRYQTSQPSQRVSAASITEPPVTPVEGKPVNLTCDAAGSVLTREWRKDGSPVSPGSNIILHDNNRVLSFSPLKRTDSGEYSCTASNPVSSAEAKYKMTIKVKQTLTLICSAESTPTATYIWMKNGTEIHTNSAEFTKSEIELSDGGEYTCQAGNNITGRTATSDVHRLSVGPQGKAV